MTTIDFVKCHRLSLEKIALFLSESVTLQSLMLNECITDERNLHLIDLLQFVFSEKSNLIKFVLEGSKPEEVNVSGFFQLNLVSECELKELNVVNSSFLLYAIQSIFSSTPELEKLDIRGINIPETLNFSCLPELRSLTIDYFHDVTTNIRTILSPNFRELIIVNRYSKSNKKVKILNIDAFKKFFKGDFRRKFCFIKCKLGPYKEFPEWLKVAKKQQKLSIFITGEYMQIYN